jgi:outer membrane protein assembly factor BamE (lipoprotein component of BamABCDE complex)
MLLKKTALFACIVVFLTSACTIVKVYEGNPLKVNPDGIIKIGHSTKAEVLRNFGPPTRFARQYDGDIFIYEYINNQGQMFELKEPLLTQTKFFLYKKMIARRDLFLILFDKQGVVLSYGYKQGA